MGSPPKKLKIGHLTYDVAMVKDLKAENGRGLYGQHIGTEQKINLLQGMHPDREIEILWHEILHAIFDLYAINQKNEEHLAAFFGHGIAAVLLSNPKLVKYIAEVAK